MDTVPEQNLLYSGGSSSRHCQALGRTQLLDRPQDPVTASARRAQSCLPGHMHTCRYIRMYIHNYEWYFSYPFDRLGTTNAIDKVFTEWFDDVSETI